MESREPGPRQLQSSKWEQWWCGPGRHQEKDKGVRFSHVVKREPTRFGDGFNVRLEREDGTPRI